VGTSSSVKFTKSDAFRVVANTQNQTHMFIVHYDSDEIGTHYITVIDKRDLSFQQEIFEFFLGMFTTSLQL
jgi:hypothetical protein